MLDEEMTMSTVIEPTHESKVRKAIEDFKDALKQNGEKWEWEELAKMLEAYAESCRMWARDADK